MQYIRLVFLIVTIVWGNAFAIGSNVRENTSSSNCPMDCNCFQRSVRCIGISSIPRRIPYDSQLLDFRFNHLTEVPANAFTSSSNVLTLYLNNNDIECLDVDALNGLKNLNFLHLAHNRIKRLPNTIFRHLKNLKAIYLENNEIQEIDPGTFNNLSKLHLLSMSNNKIINIPSDEFVGLRALKHLRLDQNPIVCDCGVYNLWKHYRNQIILHNQITIALICESPIDFQQYDFTNLQESVFHCQPPEIIISPESQDVKSGSSFIMECDAEGTPNPIISWYFNGKPVNVSNRIRLENENTELIVNEAVEADAGVYICIVGNENGKASVEATVRIQKDQKLPRLLVEPIDLEVITGTTVEIPCKAEERLEIQRTWRRDGRTIVSNVDKFKISNSGSLFIKNVTKLDEGRYECLLKNEYGRASASALLTVRNSVALTPGDRYVRIAFSEAAKEIDLAINKTVELLFVDRNNTKQNSSFNPPNYAELLRKFRFPTGAARQIARAAEIYERTLVNIRKRISQGQNLTIESEKYEFQDLLSPEHLHLLAELSGCVVHHKTPNCTDMCYHSKYRSIDGTCNNLQHPLWGASLTGFRRLIKPTYENGFSLPIGWIKNKTYFGFPMPSARLISLSLVTTKEITPDKEITHMVMQWGQFLDHDLDHALPSVSSESWDGIDCKKSCELAPPCYPIEVPRLDPRIKNRRCIDVVRSSSICGSGMTSIFFDRVQYREQINQLTSFIDASQIYGYSYEFSQELRNLTTDDGLLRIGVFFPMQKEMLPFAAPQDGMDCRRNLDENNLNCFVAGDIRVNEQVGLTAMHTIWMREHNRIANKFRDINPHWDGDTIYQEARKIVGAQMQHITYNHWLPIIIGESGVRLLGKYHGYNSKINPSIANEFATAALRFGHTIINPVLHRFNSTFQTIPQGHLPLHKSFFAPWRIAYEGGVDPLLRGMFSVPAKLKTPDQNLNAELTEKLFQTAHAVALDLAAINIQRGRDHGIPGYNAYRKLCNMTVATTFNDLHTEISSGKVRQKLENLYGHPDNIDLWVGGILEDQVEGGKVGPLFQCLLVDQLRRLRDGDRFFYENPNVFDFNQLQQIRRANLARIICDNGDNIEEITQNVFFLPKNQAGYSKCDEIPGINLYFWQDCGVCNSVPPLLSTYVPQTYPKQMRQKRSFNSYIVTSQILDNNTTAMSYSTEERYNDLKNMVDNFEKELKRLSRKISAIEKKCSKVT